MPAGGPRPQHPRALDKKGAPASADRVRAVAAVRTEVRWRRTILPFPQPSDHRLDLSAGPGWIVLFGATVRTARMLGVEARRAPQ